MVGRLVRPSKTAHLSALCLHHRRRLCPLVASHSVYRKKMILAFVVVVSFLRDPRLGGAVLTEFHQQFRAHGAKKKNDQPRENELFPSQSPFCS